MVFPRHRRFHPRRVKRQSYDLLFKAYGMSDQLTIVMPVYNEAGLLSQVIPPWIEALRCLKVPFGFRIYNDGSKDASLAVLKELASNFSEIIVVDKPNSGHGSTILAGYRDAATEWVFQTDSDGELSPDDFQKLWSCREEADFIIGIRQNRDLGML